MNLARLLSETASRHPDKPAVIDPAHRVAKSVGDPLPGVRIRVVGSDGHDVRPGDVGEVWIRGDNVFRGHWGMPDKTRESFVKNQIVEDFRRRP